jgi:hypothetical protein
MIQKKLYRLRRHEAQAKKLDFEDSKVENEGLFESLKESPLQSPRKKRLPPMENNRSQSARSGSYAPRTTSTYQS